MMIKLYDLAGRDPQLRFSPYCWRVRMALAHKGLDPETVPWRFADKKSLPGAPRQDRVPVLVDDGEVVAGSTTIAHHLEDRYSNSPSLFGGPVGDAHANFLIAWADAVLNPGIFPMIAADVLDHLHPGDHTYFRSTREKRLGMTLEKAREGREARLAGFRASLAPLRITLEGQAFLGGDEPSYADYAVFGGFQWARCVSGFELLEPDSPILAWMESLLDLFDGLARRATVAA